VTRHAKASFAGSNAALGRALPRRTRAGRATSIRTILLGLALVLAAFLLAPPSAFALEHPFLETFGSASNPSFTEAEGMAVDQSSGDLLVIDGAANTVSRYNPDGTPAEFSALGTNVIDGLGTGDEVPGGGGLSFGTPKEAQVAVDNSGGPTDGNIYVPQFGASEAVDIFAADGSYLGQLTEYNEGIAAEGSAALLGEPCGVAVDPSGNVYVGDFSEAIHKYEPAANPPENADNGANFKFAGNCTLAAGAGPTEGFIFPAHYGGAVAKLDSTTGAEEYEVDPGPTATLSVDPASGHLYTTRGSEIAEFDVSGASSAAEVSSIPLASGAQGVAVNGSSGNVYTTREGNAKVEVFGPLTPTLPTLPLTVKKGPGGGEGTVKSTPAGIDCGPACAEATAEFAEGELVKLKATAASNSEFIGWTSLAGDPGACAGSTLLCEVTMDEAAELEADFALLPAPAVTAISPSSGPTAGGGQIEITGTDLAKATQVEFGASVVSAPFSKNTATKIKVKVPGHSAGTADVIVITGGGASPNTAADDYTFVPTPAVTALGPAKGPTAGGNQVEITGLRLTNATKVQFGDTVVSAPFAENIATKLEVNAPPHAAGTVDVRVTTLGGTSGNFPVDDYTYEVPASAPEPPVNPTPTQPLVENLPLPFQCVVPKLKGLSLGKARSTLTKAHCKIGEVSKPKPRKGKKLGPLVVRSSKPGAGATLPAESKVALQLGPNPKKKSSREKSK
jgi:IPT/TIG domain/PASTA domain/Divergent InlB B-repeat domain